MTVICLSSSNMAEKLRALGRDNLTYQRHLSEYADDLDMACEAYVLDPRSHHLAKMLSELQFAGRLYKAVSGRDLKPD